ncbi:MAG: AAA family ATPase, partial [Pirellulales bacterium]
MKIKRIQIDAFGAWRQLDLGGLSEQVSVFYGPNEAGKTTLMHFVRAMLYGFDSARRRRYVPPVDGSVAGGSLDIAGASGRFQLCRRAGSGPREDDISLVASDGTVQGGHLLGVVLSGIDEAIYNNVFAIGLGEIQELGSLEDTEAAQLLHGLTAGLDRVSLVEVMHELAASREALWSEGHPSRIANLLAERERIDLEIDQRSAETHRYLRLTAERERIDRDVVADEESTGEIERELKLIDLAVGLGDRWRRRSAIDAEIGPPADARPPVVDALARLEKLREEIGSRRKRRAKRHAEYQGLVARCREMRVPAELERIAARADAMTDQAAWITSLADEVVQL